MLLAIVTLVKYALSLHICCQLIFLAVMHVKLELLAYPSILYQYPLKLLLIELVGKWMNEFRHSLVIRNRILLNSSSTSTSTWNIRQNEKQAISQLRGQKLQK